MSDLGNKEVMARNIKKYMELNKKTRKEMCKVLGFPYSTLTAWLNADIYPRIDKIELMANYFGIEKSDLIEDKEKQTEGDKLKALRLKNNLSLSELANDLHISVDDMKAYEENKKEIPVWVTSSIARYFGIETPTEFHTDRYKRMMEAMGGQILTEEEFDKVIDYVKFIVSQRGK